MPNKWKHVATSCRFKQLNKSSLLEIWVHGLQIPPRIWSNEVKFLSKFCENMSNMHVMIYCTHVYTCTCCKYNVYNIKFNIYILYIYVYYCIKYEDILSNIVYVWLTCTCWSHDHQCHNWQQGPASKDSESRMQRLRGVASSNSSAPRPRAKSSASPMDAAGPRPILCLSSRKVQTFSWCRLIFLPAQLAGLSINRQCLEFEGKKRDRIVLLLELSKYGPALSFDVDALLSGFLKSLHASEPAMDMKLPPCSTLPHSECSCSICHMMPYTIFCKC